jgi:hypothetical protein
MSRYLPAFSLVALILATPAFAAADADRAWPALTSMAGSWQRVDAKTPEQQAFRIKYHLISADSALVETFGNPAGRVTQTVYHRDGASIMATHYCAQGNQPRLRSTPGAAADELKFAFVDVTNLKSPGASHMVRLSFKRIDATHLLRTETYLSEGKEEETRLMLERAD